MVSMGFIHSSGCRFSAINYEPVAAPEMPCWASWGIYVLGGLSHDLEVVNTYGDHKSPKDRVVGPFQMAELYRL